MAGSKNAGAINKATDAQTSNNAQSLALQQQIYGENKATLAPFVGTGVAASNQINALLGLNVPQQQPTTGALGAYQPGFGNFGGNPPTVNWAGYVNGNPDALANWNAIKNNKSGARFGGDINAFGQFHYNDDGARRDLSAFTTQPAQGALAGSTANALMPQQSALSAFENYRNSTGYQFRLREGMNALNSGYAGRGVLQSGAAIRAATEYGQNFASGEFGNYLNNLQVQQNLGAGAASSQAGVGQNFAGNVTSLNTANANALAAGAVASANNTNGMIGGVTNALNSTVGALSLPQIFKR